MWVSPFGNPRIEAYLQLPEAYRSLSRPSSAPDAKAFALCSFSLELPTYIVCSLNCLSFFVKQDKFFVALKRFFLLCRLFPPFGEIVILITQIWKDSISNKLCPLYLFVFSTHLNPNIWISSFIYSIVKFHVALFWVLGGLDGLEPSTSRLSGARSSHLSYRPVYSKAYSVRSTWWRWRDSNPWPPACRAGALPTELHPHKLR